MLQHVFGNVGHLSLKKLTRHRRVNIEHIVELVHRIPDADCNRQLHHLLFTEVFFQALHQRVVNASGMVVDKVLSQIQGNFQAIVEIRVLMIEHLHNHLFTHSILPRRGRSCRNSVTATV